MPYRFIKSWICDWRYKLVGGAITILKNMKVNGKDDIPYIMENKKCLKPPTSKKTQFHKIQVKSLPNMLWSIIPIEPSTRVGHSTAPMHETRSF